MRQLDVDWDEAVRKAYHEMEHGRLFRKWLAEDEI